jgi:hypothetical protein
MPRDVDAPTFTAPEMPVETPQPGDPGFIGPLPIQPPCDDPEKGLIDVIGDIILPVTETLDPDNRGKVAGRRGFAIFKKWYHRRSKKRGDPDATPEELEQLGDEWDDSGRPDGEGNRTGPGDDRGDG